jgi:hypothetical protein
MPAAPNISATLRYGSTTIVDLSSPVYSAGTGVLTWTATLPSDVTVPEQESIALDITTAEPSVEFTIDYDSQSAPSFVELPVSTFINVESLIAYDAPYPGGVQVADPLLGDDIYIRTVVSDPFGFDDITGLDLTIEQPGGSVNSTVSANSIATVGCSRIYEYVHTVPFSTCGDFSILATAMEGFEGAVTDTELITLSAGASSISATVTPINSCDTPGNGAITVSDPSGGYGGPWEVSIDGINWFAVDANSPYTFTGLASGLYAVSIREAGFDACDMVLDNVVIAVESSLSAGEDNDVSLCFCQVCIATLPLVNFLVNADSGGVWEPLPGTNITPTGPNAEITISGDNQSYDFQYIVDPSTSTCPSDTAVISVFAELQRQVYPDFLGDFTLLSTVVCEGETTPVDLIQLGSAYIGYQPGDSVAQVAGPVTVDLSDPFSVDFSSVPPGLYEFIYIIPPGVACSQETGGFWVIVSNPIEAGDDGAVQLCEGETTPQNLFDVVTGADAEILPTIESSSGVTNLSEGTDGVNGNGIQFDAVGDEVVITFPDFTPPGTLITVYTVGRGGGSSSRTLSFTQFDFFPPVLFPFTEEVVHVSDDTLTATTFELLAPNYENGANSITISMTENNGGRIDLDHISIVGSWAETGVDSSGVAIGDGTAVDFSAVPPGTYEFTYTTPNNGVCSPSSSTATITVQDQLSAGFAIFNTFCNQGNSIINLESYLFGNDPGGIWEQTGGSPVDLSDAPNADFAGVSDGLYTFTYTHAANGGCPSDQAVVEIDYGTFLDTGVDSTVVICEGETTAIDLGAILTEESVGGFFYQISGPTTFDPAPFDIYIPSVLDFSTALPGTYEFGYNFDFAIPGCPFDPPSTTTIIVTDQLEAGADNSDQISEGSGANYDLTALLSGADPGGDWAQTSGNAIDISNPADVDFSAAAQGGYTFTYTHAASGECPQDQAVLTITVEEPPFVTLRPKLMLQGALSGTNDGLMRDDLRQAGILPTVEPYTGLGFSHISGGGESVADANILTDDIGPNSIVDWVFVELRAANDSSLVLATRSGLVQRDGDVVEVDGVSALAFPQAPAGNYYVAVCHRNHLGVMTADPITLGGEGGVLDFTSAALDVFNTSPAFDGAERADINGVKALWSGNASTDGKVIFAGQDNDKNAIFNVIDQNPGNLLGLQTYILLDYQVGDLDLDGKTVFAGQNNDVNPIFNNIDGHPGNILKLQTYVIFLFPIP